MIDSLNELAPIVLFVYNRPEHTRQTLDFLVKNKYANESSLYIFSDGAKGDSDNESVEEVRKFIRTVKGFSKIEIKEREKNFGLAKSIVSGVSEILNVYHKIIVLEDDIVTTPFFLKYMNSALRFYQPNEKIFSVSGYSYPIKIPDYYKNDVFISYRTSSWGWGTWKDRWEKVDWEVKDFDRFVKDNKSKRLFNRAGDDVTPMLKAQMRGKIDSWAIIWTYAHFKHNAFCLLPVQSFCKNIGTDRSGTHSSSSKKFDVELTKNKGNMFFSNDLNIDDEIVQRISKLVKPSLIRYFINCFKDYVH